MELDRMTWVAHSRSSVNVDEKGYMFNVKIPFRACFY